jgi:PGF-CTERM protein
LYGIDGWPDYKGNLRVEVDVVNLYYGAKSFPAPPGLLLGESYDIINGVEGPYNGTWKRNHLGPWEQKMVVTVPNAHLGAEASVIFELDQRGLVSGQVAAFTLNDELRPVSWATVRASAASITFTTSSWDGYYDMYLPAGLYEFSVYEWSPYNEGHKVKSTTMTVSSGQTVTGYSFYLERSKTPIPEFGAVIALVAAAGASLLIVRRTRRKS